MLPLCPTCKRKRRVGHRRRKINKRWYWVAYCVECKTDISMEPTDD